MSKLKEAIAKTLNGNHRLIDILKCIEDNVVKELVWEQDHLNHIAFVRFDCEWYTITNQLANGVEYYELYHGGSYDLLCGRYPTLDEAKQAAFSCHKTEILKLLNL